VSGNVTRDPVFGCVITRNVDAQGYGRVGRELAHVKAWVDAYGPVPEQSLKQKSQPTRPK
jgi:hypothetical protein